MKISRFPFALVGSGSFTILLSLLVLICILPLKRAAAADDSSQMDCNHGRAEALGVNLGNLSWDALLADNIVTGLTQSGVGWIRINMYWGWTERTRGQFDWKAADAALVRLHKAGIKVLITISGPTPCWAMQSRGNCISPQWAPENVNDWVYFVTAVVSRYKNQVHYWEIWNEPDLIQSIDIQDPNERLNVYRDRILIPGAQAVHRTDPSAKVIGPVFAAVPSGQSDMGPNLNRAFARVMTGPAAQLVDIVSFHSYYPDDANAKAIAFRNAMRAAGMGGKPIWITEIGMSPERLGLTTSERGLSYVESKQADFLTNQISKVLFSGNAQKVFWFALTDSENSSGEHTNHFGLIQNNDYKTYPWRPRLAYTALQNLVHANCSR